MRTLPRYSMMEEGEELTAGFQEAQVEFRQCRYFRKKVSARNGVGRAGREERSNVVMRSKPRPTIHLRKQAQ